MGSSPLTRGKPAPRCAGARGRGLIPAHAGKTFDLGICCREVRAHPRSRGENYEAHALAIQTGGSSPLTRGKQGLHERLFGCLGLIPAHAGKTFPIRAVLINNWAHPRSRGENIRQETNGYGNLGSSPLTRGKQGRGPRGRGGPGLIPAHAGKTFSAGFVSTSPRAHPRSRGENSPTRP